MINFTVTNCYVDRLLPNKNSRAEAKLYTSLQDTLIQAMAAEEIDLAVLRRLTRLVIALRYAIYVTVCYTLRGWSNAEAAIIRCYIGLNEMT